MLLVGRLLFNVCSLSRPPWSAFSCLVNRQFAQLMMCLGGRSTWGMHDVSCPCSSALADCQKTKFVHIAEKHPSFEVKVPATDPTVPIAPGYYGRPTLGRPLQGEDSTG